jgi:hypothetical protein
MFEELALPKADEFVAGVVKEKEAQQALAEPPKPTPGMEKAALAEQSKRGISEEFKGLLVQYCATYLQATELAEVDFRALAVRLGTRLEFVTEAAEIANVNDALWMDVLAERIKRVGAARTFRDFTWERIESLSLSMLGKMLDKNLIRDPGELIAIANHARKINVADQTPGQSNNGVNINFNLGGSEVDSGLPASGAKMTIDLSPRLASSLANRGMDRSNERVIDAKMISASELREVLATKKAEQSQQKEG